MGRVKREFSARQAAAALGALLAIGYVSMMIWVFL